MAHHARRPSRHIPRSVHGPSSCEPCECRLCTVSGGGRPSLGGESRFASVPGNQGSFLRGVTITSQSVAIAYMVPLGGYLFVALYSYVGATLPARISLAPPGEGRIEQMLAQTSQ